MAIGKISTTWEKDLVPLIKNLWLHIFYVVIIIGLQLINFHAIGFTKHKSDWCNGFYEEFRKGL